MRATYDDVYPPNARCTWRYGTAAPAGATATVSFSSFAVDLRKGDKQALGAPGVPFPSTLSPFHRPEVAIWGVSYHQPTPPPPFGVATKPGGNLTIEAGMPSQAGYQVLVFHILAQPDRPYTLPLPLTLRFMSDATDQRCAERGFVGRQLCSAH